MENNSNGIGSAAFYKLLQEAMSTPDLAPEGTPLRLAQDYAREKGLTISSREDIVTAKVKPAVSAKVAEAFAQMKHDPNNPKVAKAYEALIRETEDQFKALEKAGLKISKMEPGMDNPYKNSAALVDDITKNKHMWYYPTEQGFGSGGDFSDHPLFKETKVLAPDGKPMKGNDLFRVVHDYFGHAKDGNKFGATGEERAYLAHKEMYSPEARKALASETRGQNSWVNYGPAGEANRANPGSTTYADQKAGLLPDWATKHVDEIDSPLKYRAKALAKMAGKSAIPVLAAGSALAAPTADTGLTELLVPGGTPNLGQSPEEESQLLAEIQARKDYLNSPASQDAEEAQSLRKNILRSLAGK
ncbi:MAG TPA: hypothetical protein VGD26_10415 [Chitinophagaceae bacterium]